MSKGELKYLSFTPRDEEWGIVTTSVGYQFIEPNEEYPLIGHPQSYNFSINGRRLNEYQLVYIIKGNGSFISNSVKQQPIGAGTMILLFPGEWHNYSPMKKTGWHEYWVGFRGKNIDNRVKKEFLSKKNPLFKIGINADIIETYNKILRLVKEDKQGYQQMASSMVLHLLGEVYYRGINFILDEDTLTANKINEAKLILKENLDKTITAQEVSERINVSYSWLRQMFKKHTGVSPIQYYLQQKHLLAKELLSTTNQTISEVAYQLNYENVSQFSNFFKEREGVSPTNFRKSFS